jgi:hypothetical protein
MSEMLAKCYNKFLFIARCMEQQDEKGVWTIIKDAIFSTAHNMTRVHDARTVLVTGTTLYTNKANTDNGLIREKAKKRIKKEGRKDPFFPYWGGSTDPPHALNTTIAANLLTFGVSPPALDGDDILAGSSLVHPNYRRVDYAPPVGGGRFNDRLQTGGRNKPLAGGTVYSGANNYAWASRRIASKGKGGGGGRTLPTGSGSSAPQRSGGEGGGGFGRNPNHGVPPP